MPKFTLEPPPEPIQVRYLKVSGLLSANIHLTDNRKKTLCGLTGTLAVVPAGEETSCRKCVQAHAGSARFRRVIR